MVGTMQICVRVQPRASKEEIIVEVSNSYKVYMHKPAMDGRANKKLVEMLARHFGTKKNRIRITQGRKRKDKIVEIT